MPSSETRSSATLFGGSASSRRSRSRPSAHAACGLPAQLWARRRHSARERPSCRLPSRGPAGHVRRERKRDHVRSKNTSIRRGSRLIHCWSCALAKLTASSQTAMLSCSRINPLTASCKPLPTKAFWRCKASLSALIVAKKPKLTTSRQREHSERQHSQRDLECQGAGICVRFHTWCRPTNGPPDHFSLNIGLGRAAAASLAQPKVRTRSVAARVTMRLGSSQTREEPCRKRSKRSPATPTA